MKKVIDLFNGKKAVFKLSKNKYTKLKKFAGCLGGGIYALNNIGCNYYWFSGMKQGGEWYRGGFSVSEILTNPEDFLDIKTGEVWIYIKEIN